MKEPGDGPNQGIGDGYALMSVGITFALTLVAGTLGGLWLDRRLGTTPLLTLIGMAAGLGLGGFWLWQRVGARPKSGD